MLEFNLIYEILKNNFYFESDELFLSVFYLAGFFSLLVFILSIIYDNVSMVDRLWPILPTFYVWVYTLYPVIRLNEEINMRLLLSSLLVTVWGVRLTYNYYRKGGYEAKAEDYRWEYVKKFVTSKILYTIFNFSFISVYQNYLLLGFTLPGYYMFLYRSNPLNFWDLINFILFAIFLTIEIIADQQQWNFQTEKKRLALNNKLEGMFKTGFIRSGLFKYSRHPNFFAEMMIWWSYYLFSVSSSGHFVNFSIIGTVLLTLLFQGSTLLTEYITKSKYPQYAVYQKSVSRFIPLPPKESKYE